MAFPAVTLLDSFKREENPLSNGGKWKSVAFLSGGVGRCKESIDWENLAAHDLEGAYWSPGEFTAPCAVAICRDKKINDAGAWFVMACVTHPTTSKFSGYRVMMAHTGTISGTEGKFTVTIERCDEESFTVLSTTTEEVFKEGDRLGIAVQEGHVQYWRKAGAGAWEERASHADATYSTGYALFGVSSAENGNTTDFEAGPVEGGPPVITNPGTQHSVINKPVSLQIKATNATEYKAEGLPEGLAINEGTGLITGEPTKLETTTVKLKAIGPEGEAEAEFEWIIEATSSLINQTYLIL